uniref:DUF1016 N-terminal domain-containing protein n=1 Tax=Cupriavidus ulmosensis TaxID=3065913 RepID=UPI00296ADA0A|nr:DUF1016 N-terminal domain-containing protein [Cupriavidus sp. CV2]
MTASYWEIGRRIVEFEQGGQDRTAYGQALFKRLSADLSTRFGRGFSERNLEQMRSFYQEWPLERISQTASAKLPCDSKVADIVCDFSGYRAFSFAAYNCRECFSISI